MDNVWTSSPVLRATTPPAPHHLPNGSAVGSFREHIIRRTVAMSFFNDIRQKSLH